MIDTLHVRVGRIDTEAEGIRSLRLEPVDGRPLPPAEPGAHIDLQLAPGLTRQYSLTNGPDECADYRIAVKREPASRGGSAAVHERVAVGDELTISRPRSNFELSPEAARHVLLAGGIGITPLLAMGKHLHRQGAAFRLHYFARAPRYAAFGDWLAACGWRQPVDFQYGLEPGAQRQYLERLLRTSEAGTHLYMCGPGPFMEMVAEVARQQGWPEARVHCEYFSAPAPVDASGGAFELHLARSGLTLQVPDGVSIVDVMRQAGVEVETSCEQGVCGTCMCTVLEGQPDHRDLYLNEAERAEGKLMLPCVSRSRGARLVLDR
jgi:vanillate O-demethylase ferredoxin subunit